MTFDRAIGGEMAIAPADFMARGGGGGWPGFAGRHHVRCDSGRTALGLAVAHWCAQGRRPSAVWLPDYLCHSVAAGVLRAGVPLRFYEDSPDDLAEFVPPAPDADDLVVAVHYFGRINERMLSFACAGRRSWGLIEDCVQSAYSDGAGVTGEYAVTSLRKWWPVTDGATLHFDDPGWVAPVCPPDEGFVSRRLLAKLLREGDGASEQRYLELVAESEERLDRSAIARAPSWLSCALLDEADVPRMKARRRANLEVLVSRLQEVRRPGGPLRVFHPVLAPGEVPLVCPVRVPAEVRDALRSRLADRRIFCPIHWRLDAGAAPAAQTLASQMLSLPLDQRYDECDMRRLADEVGAFFEGLLSE